jgi:hypothetical protein
MPSSAVIVGSGGVRVSSTTTPIGQLAGSVPPELHLNQWGILRLDIGPTPQERS